MDKHIDQRSRDWQTGATGEAPPVDYNRSINAAADRLEARDAKRLREAEKGKGS